MRSFPPGGTRLHPTYYPAAPDSNAASGSVDPGRALFGLTLREAHFREEYGGRRREARLRTAPTQRVAG